jgi:hypothetical protein
MENNYSYDLFISYRRHPSWSNWVREHVCRLLDDYLTRDLGRQPHVFVDQQIEPGQDWPDRLGNALGRARILLPIYSLDYFSSHWCLHELDLMHARGQATRCRLIFPALAHDGDQIPQELRRISHVDWKTYANTDIQPRTKTMEQWGNEIKRFTPQLAQAINETPLFDVSWSVECIQRFESLYQASLNDDLASLLPATFKPENPPAHPSRPPRVQL